VQEGNGTVTSSEEPLIPVTSAEDRRKHLDYIQAVVTRMSAASTTTKSWLLPVVTATYGYALTKKADSVALLGIAAVLLFGFLDANYLRQEKAYRRLYDVVARGTRQVPPFSLDPSDADDPSGPTAGTLQRTRQLIRRWVPDRAVWQSWSIAPFYGALVIVGAVIFVRVR
jgi:histidine triad (HIT) family protein